MHDVPAGSAITVSLSGPPETAMPDVRLPSRRTDVEPENRPGRPSPDLFLDDVCLFDGRSVHAPGALFAAGGVVEASGPRDEVIAAISDTRLNWAITYRGGGRLAIPGLINPHHHLYASLSRPLLSGDSPPRPREPHKRMHWLLAAFHDEDSVYYSAVTGLLAGLRRGVTTVVNHHLSLSVVDGVLDVLASAFGDVDARGLICFACSDHVGAPDITDQIRENVDFAARHRGDPMIQGAFGIQDAASLSDDAMNALSTSKPDSLPLIVHLAETAENIAYCRTLGYEGPVDRVRRAGFLDQTAWVVPGAFLPEEERQALLEFDPVIVVNPETLALNGRIAQRTRAQGRCVVGTDGLSDDVVAAVRCFFLDQRRSRSAGEEDAPLVNLWAHHPGDALGAIFPGIGRLTPNAPADVAVFDYAPSICGEPPVHPEELSQHLVFGAYGRDAWLTMVEGRPVFHQGRFLNLDIDTLSREAHRVLTGLHRRFRE